MTITATAPLPHEPHWVSRAAFPLVSAGLMLSYLGIGLAVHRGAWWLAAPLVLLAAHFAHGILIGFHEASHGLLRRNRLINEIDGMLIGLLGFTSFSLYRAAHQTHHAHLATERDEELWPFVQRHQPRWFRVAFAFLELFAGLLVTPTVFLRTFIRAGSPIRSPRVRRRIRIELGGMVLVWTGILATVAWLDLWTYFIWIYLLPSWLAANLQSWRKYIEHVGMEGDTPNSSTRSIVAPGPLGRLFALTLLHEPYHGVHHQHAGVAHPELPQYASSLEPKTAGEKPPFRSYRHALADLFRTLADPRVGAHWRV